MNKSASTSPQLGSGEFAPISPVGKTRSVKSWDAALAELNLEARALTEKLEEHADQVEQLQLHRVPQRSSTGSIPSSTSSSSSSLSSASSLDLNEKSKPRVKSALAELPPLRRSNIMIDPLPISKEKEAVLSRTRPSWLPPKDPAEERRHLKEYRQMMAMSAESEKRRSAAARAKRDGRDAATAALARIWETDVLPRWETAMFQERRRTRDLWWRGVPPRLRGEVWTRAVGNDLGLTETSYKAALGRAKEAEARPSGGAAGGLSADEVARQAAWFAAIRRDAEEKTFCELRIFQPGGPLHHSLVDVLSAYAMYRSDIGYVTGCNVSK
jgi:hypothetical protein